MRPMLIGASTLGPPPRLPMTVLIASSSACPCLPPSGQCCEARFQLAVLSRMINMLGLPLVPPDEPMKISVSSAVARNGANAVPRQSTNASALDRRDLGNMFIASSILARSGAVGGDDSRRHPYRYALRHIDLGLGHVIGRLGTDLPHGVRT